MKKLISVVLIFSMISMYGAGAMASTSDKKAIELMLSEKSKKNTVKEPTLKVTGSNEQVESVADINLAGQPKVGGKLEKIKNFFKKYWKHITATTAAIVTVTAISIGIGKYVHKKNVLDKKGQDILSNVQGKINEKKQQDESVNTSKIIKKGFKEMTEANNVLLSELRKENSEICNMANMLQTGNEEYDLEKLKKVEELNKTLRKMYTKVQKGEMVSDKDVDLINTSLEDVSKISVLNEVSYHALKEEEIRKKQEAARIEAERIKAAKKKAADEEAARQKKEDEEAARKKAAKEEEERRINEENLQKAMEAANQTGVPSPAKTLLKGGVETITAYGTGGTIAAVSKGAETIVETLKAYEQNQNAKKEAKDLQLLKTEGLTEEQKEQADKINQEKLAQAAAEVQIKSIQIETEKKLAEIERAKVQKKLDREQQPETLTKQVWDATKENTGKAMKATGKGIWKATKWVFGKAYQSTKTLYKKYQDNINKPEDILVDIDNGLNQNAILEDDTVNNSLNENSVLDIDDIGNHCLDKSGIQEDVVLNNGNRVNDNALENRVADKSIEIEEEKNDPEIAERRDPLLNNKGEDAVKMNLNNANTND